jgi:GNAT superfamily N-acetyltransferase
MHSYAVVTEENVVLRDGSCVAIRPLATGDQAAVAEWFAGLGPETRHARFLGSIKDLDARTLACLAAVDHRDQEAVTAVAPDGRTVGIARYMRAPGSCTAEVAVAVVDRWRGRGIAGLLLRRIAALARSAGIDTFVALCLASNETVIRLLSRLGSTTIDEPMAGVVELRIRLGDWHRSAEPDEPRREEPEKSP